MGETWQYVFSILSLLCLGGAAGWFLLRRQNRKLKAETEKIDSDKALSVTGAADQRLVDLLTTQTEGIVNPLLEEVKRYRGEVEGLREEVNQLRKQIANVTRLYRLVLEWVRVVMAWKKAHPNLDPPLPDLPVEIVEEL